ncbi:MAG: SRPBCC domain-containing protein [Synechococcales cyanobacterium T60_A2020_003]|nr:SRPBCC domain-containing protein [Synechococcales cyanobacterium T60_A2020_003]
MPSLSTEITIRAARSQVWQALIHKERWLYWNTFLFDRDPARPLSAGNHVMLSVRRTEDDDEIEFQSYITVVQPNACLQWLSTAPGFKSQHSFELQDVDVDVTRYRHQERFSGAMSSLLLPFIRRDELQGLRRMAHELKNYVEYPQRRRG